MITPTVHSTMVGLCVVGSISILLIFTVGWLLIEKERLQKEVAKLHGALADHSSQTTATTDVTKRQVQTAEQQVRQAKKTCGKAVSSLLWATNKNAELNDKINWLASQLALKANVKRPRKSIKRK